MYTFECKLYKTFICVQLMYAKHTLIRMYTIFKYTIPLYIIPIRLYREITVLSNSSLMAKKEENFQ